MRLRVRFREVGPIRFIGHRDLARLWERAIRRAELPVAYSEGFSPRPKLHFGLALSVGHESEAEYLDLDLYERVEVADLVTRLSAALPEGLEVTAVAEVSSNAEALQAAVDLVTWHAEVPDLSAADLRDRAERLLARDVVETVVVRKGKEVTVDVRPAVVGLEVRDVAPPGHAAAQGPVLVAELATRPRAVRPAELWACFEPPIEPRLVRRHEQWAIHDGVRRPLLAADAHEPVVEPLAS